MFPRGNQHGIDRTPFRSLSRQVPGPDRPATQPELPVAEWAETFLSLCRRLEYTSRATYERDLRRYVLPRFGDYRIGSLPAEKIENWLNDELDAGIAPSSVHRHYRTLRRMLQVAVDKEKLLINPCDRVEAPRVPAVEMTFLNWDEVIELADTHKPRFRALILFAVETGMRWSELVGLRRAATSTYARGGSGSPSSSCASEQGSGCARNPRRRPLCVPSRCRPPWSS